MIALGSGAGGSELALFGRRPAPNWLCLYHWPQGPANQLSEIGFVLHNWLRIQPGCPKLALFVRAVFHPTTDYRLLPLPTFFSSPRSQRVCEKSVYRSMGILPMSGVSKRILSRLGAQSQGHPFGFAPGRLWPCFPTGETPVILTGRMPVLLFKHALRPSVVHRHEEGLGEVSFVCPTGRCGPLGGPCSYYRRFSMCVCYAIIENAAKKFHRGTSPARRAKDHSPAMFRIFGPKA